jgi:hypothetical protein
MLALDTGMGYGEGMSKKEKLDVLDLIIDVLCAHEIMLDAMIERLESLCHKLETILPSDEAQRTKEMISKLSEDPIKMIQDG